MGVPSFDTPDFSELFAEEKDIIKRLKKVFLMVAGSAKRFGEETQAAQIAMSKYYLYKAVDIVSDKGKEAIISFAEGDEQKMMFMGLKRFTKYTNYPNIVALRTQIADKVASDNGYTFD